MGEFAAIERIRRLFPSPPPGQAWIGDDAAVLDDGLLLAVDTVVAGVHFAADTPLADVGWKALTVNVSDIAAMGGTPRHAVVAVAAPPDTDLDLIYEGMAEASATYGCPVVGGDLANAAQLVVTVAVTGRVDGTPVLRSGARPGDGIYVTGPLGGAAAGAYRARPRARVAEGQAARAAGATAMIDVSDGLVADLGHIADASGVGYELDLAAVPVAPGATAEQALRGGEDYELVFTGTDLSVGTRIGTCTADVSQRLPGGGWEHTFT
ncbi:MAG TPA: thiamine-phosphate kinase [Acidimicrobiales bacterium]|nr:thiamine-phosphate kinase [Acidimicrobiales bacterium]